MIVHYKRLAGCFLLGQKFSCSPGACSEMLVDRTLLTLLLVVIFAIRPLSPSKDPNSILQFYQHLLALRHQDPALLEGDYVDLKPNNDALLAYLRRFGDESVLVVLNMSGKPQTVSLNVAGRAKPHCCPARVHRRSPRFFRGYRNSDCSPLRSTSRDFQGRYGANREQAQFHESGRRGVNRRCCHRGGPRRSCGNQRRRTGEVLM